MALLHYTCKVTQAGGYVDLEVVSATSGAIRVPEAWWLQVECCLTSNANLPSPPLVNPSAGSLAIGVRTPGANGFAPALIDGAASVSLLALPLARVVMVIPAAMRFTPAGLDADKTLLITLNGMV